jgi:t-SNARE complex subunit (syntaxin)
MKHLDIEVLVKDLDKLFNDMQDKAVAGSALVTTAARVIENQAEEISEMQRLFDKAMDEWAKDKK